MCMWGLRGSYDICMIPNMCCVGGVKIVGGGVSRLGVDEELSEHLDKRVDRLHGSHILE